MLTTLEYVTDGVIDSQQQHSITRTANSGHRTFFRGRPERISRATGRRGAPPMGLEVAAVRPLRRLVRANPELSRQLALI